MKIKALKIVPFFLTGSGGLTGSTKQHTDFSFKFFLKTMNTRCLFKKFDFIKFQPVGLSR